MLTKKVNLISKYSAPNKQNTSARLLDIGCGTGYFLDKARTKGYEVSGIEKDGHSRDFAKDKFKLNINDEDALWNIENKLFRYCDSLARPRAYAESKQSGLKTQPNTQTRRNSRISSTKSQFL
jgi:SAM-dependent methyltransferase